MSVAMCRNTLICTSYTVSKTIPNKKNHINKCERDTMPYLKSTCGVYGKTGLSTKLPIPRCRLVVSPSSMFTANETVKSDI